MSRSYTPKPWEDRSGVAFVSNNARKNGEALRLRQNISHAPAQPLLVRIRDDWQARKPYYVILFTITFIVVLAIALFIRASLS